MFKPFLDDTILPKCCAKCFVFVKTVNYYVYFLDLSVKNQNGWSDKLKNWNWSCLEKNKGGGGGAVISNLKKYILNLVLGQLVCHEFPREKKSQNIFWKFIYFGAGRLPYVKKDIKKQALNWIHVYLLDVFRWQIWRKKHEYIKYGFWVAKNFLVLKYKTSFIYLHNRDPSFVLVLVWQQPANSIIQFCIIFLYQRADWKFEDKNWVYMCLNDHLWSLFTIFTILTISDRFYHVHHFATFDHFCTVFTIFDNFDSFD